MGQQPRWGPPHLLALLPLLGALLLAGLAGGFDDSATSTSSPRDQADHLQDLCRDPKVVGRCRASILRWWYNVTAQACHSFIYGGCDGNYNNFLTQKDCLKACDGVADNSAKEAPGKRSGAPEPSPSAPLKEDSEVYPVTDFNYEEFCMAKAVTGPCRAAFPRWYFDVETNTCAHFIYGGCRGNKNSYLTQQDCMSKCFGGQTHKSPHPVIPHSPKAVALAVLLAVIAAVLLGAVVVILVKIARRHQASTFNSVWSPIDDKEYLVKNTYTL